MLTSKQRAYLRGMSQELDTIFQIGKSGVTEEICLQLSNALEARELVKVTVLKNAPYETREACDMLCESVGAAPVQCIGQKFVMYKPSRKHKTIELVKK